MRTELAGGFHPFGIGPAGVAGITVASMSKRARAVCGRHPRSRVVVYLAPDGRCAVCDIAAEAAAAADRAAVLAAVTVAGRRPTGWDVWPANEAGPVRP
jgi:hypothetical protein